MNTQEILRQLQNSGIRVLGTTVDSSTVYIEDPACILRSFETFMDYAWVIISIITGIMLFGWAIALLRGAKNTVPTNLRNLIIMFATLATIRPIANMIWGGDLFGRGCRQIAISTDTVRQIISQRDKKLHDSEKLYEVLDIHDTGTVHVAVSNTPGNGNSAPTPPSHNRPISEPRPQPIKSERYAVSAIASNKDVIYTHNDGTRTRYTGGTRAWRNTNPGNLRDSKFARNTGAIGVAGGFAVFPTEQVGTTAIINLMRSQNYRNLTIADAISRYAPPSENDTAAYRRRIAELTGLSINTRIADLNDEQLGRVAAAIRRIEGWKAGQKIEL